MIFISSEWIETISPRHGCFFCWVVTPSMLYLTGYSLFLLNNKLEGLQLYYKETPTQLFSCEYCEISKNTYFEEHLRTATSGIYMINLYDECQLINHEEFLGMVGLRTVKCRISRRAYCKEASLLWISSTVSRWNSNQWCSHYTTAALPLHHGLLHHDTFAIVINFSFSFN